METLDQVIEIFKKSSDILFITGAGISAESGLPTYRGIGGLYEDTPTEDGIPIEMALAGEMLQTRPEITWKYLSQIEKNCRKAKFNRAHKIIADMESVFPRVWTLTQNIDGFHREAGSINLIEIHGNMHHIYCSQCRWSLKIKDFSKIEIPPKCPDCGHIARPAVVFFGEMLPEQALDIYSRELRKGFDLYVWIGTTSVFPYIQDPVYDAKRRGAVSVEINPDETEISHLVDYKLPLKAAQSFELIWQGIK